MGHQKILGDNNIQVGRDLVQVIIHGPGPGDGDRAELLARPFYLLLVVAICLTTIPHPYINIVSGFSVVLLWLAWSRITGKLIRPVLSALVVMSIATGCGGPLASSRDNFETRFCTDNQPCQMVTVTGMGILGYGLEDTTREAVVKKLGFNKVVDSQRTVGYGLISVATITVWGE